MKSKRLLWDICLTVGLLILAGAVFLVMRAARSPGSTVEVTLGGEKYAELPLSQDAELDVGGHLTVKISGGRAWVEHSECKNQICVRHAPISGTGEAIICLPAGITVRITGSSGPDFVI